MSDPELIPINEAPDWVRGIVDDEELLPEELASAQSEGNLCFRLIKPKNGENFIICYHRDTGEPTHIVWL